MISEAKLSNDQSLTNDARKHGHQAVEIEKFIFANFFDFWHYCIHLSSLGIVDIRQIQIFAAWNLIQRIGWFRLLKFTKLDIVERKVFTSSVSSISRKKFHKI